MGATLLFAQSPRAATIVSTSHPNALYYGFNDGKVPFEPFVIPQGVPSGARFAPENGALKITNAFAGSFSVNTKIPAFNADELSELHFDYKVNPDVKVNFFFRVNGKFYGVTFTGPNTVKPNSVLIGKVADAKADGQWHHAYIPLRDWLRKVDPVSPQLNVEVTGDLSGVLIGNWDNSGWLMAGVGGNGPGATWWMDNLALVGAGNSEVKLDVRDDKGQPFATPPVVKWTLDGAPAGDNAPLTIKAGAGFHLAEARDAAGKLLAAHPFAVATGALKVGEAQLAGNRLRVPINAPFGLNLPALKLTVDGKDFNLTSKFLSWDGEELVLDAGGAGLQWKNGAKVAVATSEVRDTKDHVAAPTQSSVTVDYEAGKAAPSLPAVQFEGTEAPRPPALKRNEEAPPTAVPAPIFGAGDGTFEEDMDEWTTTAEGDAYLERDSTTAASGKYSLRLTCPANAARFWATIRTSGFDAAKVPIISFDYKVSAQLRVDFMLLFEGRTYSIQFTDKDNPAPSLGRVPDVITDNKWHHAEINIGAMLRATAPGRASYRVDTFYIGDAQWLGNAASVQYWFDNFQFVPLLGGSPQRAALTLPDVTGLKATSWLLDDKRDTEPPATANGSDKIELTGSGRKWLHVRAQNGAGMWGPTLDVPIWLSDGPPKVAQNAIIPASGARAVPIGLEIPLHAEGGITPDSVKLAVAGRDYTLADAALKYDVAQEKLHWDAAEALEAGHITPPANGARVDWKLQPVRDFLGRDAEAVEGFWLNDFAQDKAGPKVRLASETHAPFLFDAAENAASWKPQLGVKVTPIERDGVPNRALRFTNEVVAGEFLVTAPLPETPTWDPQKFSLVRFDYRIPATANLAIRLKFTNGRSWYLQLAGEKPEKIIGSIPEIVADGQWHSTAFNISDYLQRDQNLRNQVLSGFEFRDASMKTAPNVSWDIDNFIVQQPGGATVKLAWRAADLSGVKAYRFGWDQKPDSAPTEETQDVARTVTGAAGLWFAHLQAQDGAGNWGPVVHLPIVGEVKITPPALLAAGAVPVPNP